MIKVALSGINGRMGQMLLKAVLAASDMELSAALGHSGSSAIGKDAGVPSGITTGVTVTDDIESLRDCDVLIDFSRPEATLLSAGLRRVRHRCCDWYHGLHR